VLGLEDDSVTLNVSGTVPLAGFCTAGVDADMSGASCDTSMIPLALLRSIEAPDNWTFGQ
jgi:hypothetical protein